MRRTPSDSDTIIDLLEKCQRNFRGIELRTAEQPAEFSREDMKLVTKLVESITSSLSGLDERLVFRHTVASVRQPKPPKKLSALQEYTRKYK